MRSSRHSGLLAAATGLALGAGLPAAAMPQRTSATPPRPRRPLTSELTDVKAREIAEWNAAVEQRKAERQVQRAQRKSLTTKP